VLAAQGELLQRKGARRFQQTEAPTLRLHNGQGLIHERRAQADDVEFIDRFVAADGFGGVERPAPDEDR
jgi:hypothetical protein